MEHIHIISHFSLNSHVMSGQKLQSFPPCIVCHSVILLNYITHCISLENVYCNSNNWLLEGENDSAFFLYIHIFKLHSLYNVNNQQAIQLGGTGYLMVECLTFSWCMTPSAMGCLSTLNTDSVLKTQDTHSPSHSPPTHIHYSPVCSN